MKEPTFLSGEGRTQRILSTAIATPILERPVPSLETTMIGEIWGATDPYSIHFLFPFHAQF